jgi:alpha-tubulin suppressor-like RCC1 family protein
MGQLGNGDRLSALSPVRLDFPFHASCVALGSDFSICSTACGRVFTWGNNDGGRLGLGVSCTAAVLAPAHVAVDGFVASVAAGCSHGMAITDDGMLFTWGDGKKGSVGELVGRIIWMLVCLCDGNWFVVDEYGMLALHSH